MDGNFTFTTNTTFNAWDASGLHVLDNSNASYSTYTAKEGNHLIQVVPDANEGWWGIGLGVGGADLTDYNGFMVFDMNTKGALAAIINGDKVGTQILAR